MSTRSMQPARSINRTQVQYSAPALALLFFSIESVKIIVFYVKPNSLCVPWNPQIFGSQWLCVLAYV